MGASFPNGIASFKEHRDLLDDVEAADINKIQAEVVAIEETLGDAITTLILVQQEIDDLGESTDAIATIRFDSLAALIQALWVSSNVIAASASVSNKKLPASNQPIFPPSAVNLSKPDSADDPFLMWNGNGFTTIVSGFWVVEGQIIVKLGANSPTNVGDYVGSVAANSEDYTKGLDIVHVSDQTQDTLVLRPSFSGWLPKGTRISLLAQSFTGAQQVISNARLSLHRVRGR